MSVYAAYALLVMHVMLGIAQAEHHPVLIGLTGLGLFAVVGSHLAAAVKQTRQDKANKPDAAPAPANIPEAFVYACSLDDIADNRAKMLLIGTENIAIFKYDGKLSAVHNLCRHQNGPLGEGKIIDGCITCPWHGYQYLPENGQSPPPFTEKVCTYDLIIQGSQVFINPNPYPEGTSRPPAVIQPSIPLN
jgi:nitrite reductase/ring-hydroxylating ferredoxin subunit